MSNRRAGFRRRVGAVALGLAATFVSVEQSYAQSLFEYLSGWFGGPNLYIEKKGHPRLRMRHLPYAIGPTERNEWMLCMRTALTEQVADESLRAGLLKAFGDMADHMVNTDDSAGCGHGHRESASSCAA